jgi:hypothetical protein
VCRCAVQAASSWVRSNSVSESDLSGRAYPLWSARAADGYRPWGLDAPCQPCYNRSRREMVHGRDLCAGFAYVPRVSSQCPLGALVNSCQAT